MGGFFGIVSDRDCLEDVYFGTDYHSHLGAKRAGIAAYDPEYGLQRKIHSIEDSPFRTKFAEIFHEINAYIFETECVDLNHLYIDGTKIEANANRYTWV